MKIDYSDEGFYQECFLKSKDRSLKTLLTMYRGRLHLFFLSTLFFVIKHSPVLLLPIVTANIINHIEQGQKDIRYIAVNCLVIAVLVMINVPMNYLYVMCKSLAVRNVEAGLRGAIVRKLQQLTYEYHNNNQSGRLQSKIMRDVEAVETVSTQLFTTLLNIMANIAIALCITLEKSKIVFMFFLISVPVAALTIVLFRKKIKTINTDFRKEMEATSAEVIEMVELIPITRAHALETEAVRRINTHLEDVAQKGYRLDLVQALFGSVSWAVFQLFQLGCLLFTAYQAIEGRIRVGDIVIYQSYFTTIVNQISSLLLLFPTITKGLESVKSIGEVLLSNEVEENEGKDIVEDVKGEFAFHNTEFSYGEKKILRGLNLEIPKGKTIALVGESGAGKTTILNMLIGYITPDKGDMLIDGRDMRQIDLRSYRKHIAVVPQNTVLFAGTIRDNITYGLTDVSDEELQRVIEAANLKDYIEGLPDGLDTVIGEHGSKLSGGQRQRVSIARALIRKPQVIFFDEATSALDSISEKMIQDALENLTRGKTTVIVAHRLSTIRNADIIAVIREGKCVEIGNYDELMSKKGEFYQLKMIQNA
ncbi:MAG TPA: ABC transporter [Eubacterium sp.]|nr:ABC transporter [Eubacterium sp.]